MAVQVAFDLLIRIALFDGLAFGVLLFSSAETDLHFGEAFFAEKDTQGDDGIALFLHLVLQLTQLAFGEKEFPVVDGDMVVGGTEAIFGDMHVPDPEFPLEEDAEAIHEIDLAIADGFHLGAGQYHARIEFLFDEVIMIGRSVLYFFTVRDNLKFTDDIFLFPQVDIAVPIVSGIVEQEAAVSRHFLGDRKGID